MKLSLFLEEAPKTEVLSALTDFMNAKLLSVRAAANSYLIEAFCKVVGIDLTPTIVSRAEISVTFPDVKAVNHLQEELKLSSFEALTPVLLNKHPRLVEISLLIL